MEPTAASKPNGSVPALWPRPRYLGQVVEDAGHREGSGDQLGHGGHVHEAPPHALQRGQEGDTLVFSRRVAVV